MSLYLCYILGEVITIHVDEHRLASSTYESSIKEPWTLTQTICQNNCDSFVKCYTKAIIIACHRLVIYLWLCMRNDALFGKFSSISA